MNKCILCKNLMIEDMDKKGIKPFCKEKVRNFSIIKNDKDILELKNISIKKCKLYQEVNIFHQS